MKLKKGGVYSVSMDDGTYFYVYHLTGGGAGDLIKVINYVTEHADDDVDRILKKPSLYPSEYIIGFLEPDDTRLSLSGQITINYKELMGESFYTRHSIQCNTAKESFNGDVGLLRRRYEAGEIYVYDDWILEEHKIIGPRGKFDVVKEHYVGKLPPEYINYFNSMIFPHVGDFIQMVKEGVDRNVMLSMVYR